MTAEESRGGERTRRRSRPAALSVAPPAHEETAPATKVARRAEPPPFLLDFYPLETEQATRLSPFFRRLREGRLATTRCVRDKLLHWPPRVACPRCHTEELEWVDLPGRGRVYAFSAVLAGAPLGMEADVPFVVGLVDLEGVPLRLFGRIDGIGWQECRIGTRVSVETYEIPDGRWFYRFRADG